MPTGRGTCDGCPPGDVKTAELLRSNNTPMKSSWPGQYTGVVRHLHLYNLYLYLYVFTSVGLCICMFVCVCL